MNPNVVGIFIPIVAIVFGIGAAMLSSWTEHKRRSQLLEQSHRERMMALEKGVPVPDIPDNLINGKSADRDPRRAVANAIRVGVLMVGIGVVLYFALLRIADEGTALFGLIPAVIGVANLVYAGLLARNLRAVD
jgi:cadmium resistance protein CadD (predicted permease)